MKKYVSYPIFSDMYFINDNILNNQKKTSVDITIVNISKIKVLELKKSVTTSEKINNEFVIPQKMTY